MEAQSYDLALEILDYQLVDVDGRLAGNVDDIEIELPEGWPDASAGDAPVVSGLLSGPGVLADRFGGRVGHGWASFSRRLNPSPEISTLIPMAHVRSINGSIRLGITRDRVASYGFESWFRRKVVSKIPGAKHAPE